MSRFNIDGVQNVQVSRPISCQRTPLEQLEIMEAYTRTYQEHFHDDKARREIECLKVLYPALFRTIEDDDLIAGRLDFLPIGFGSVTSVGGVGHYCVFHKLREFKTQLIEAYWPRVDALYEYWQDHDVKALYCNDVLDGVTTGRFIDCTFPYLATARLSGMMLDYKKLVDLGIKGLVELIDARIARHPHSEFLLASREALDLFQSVVDYQIELCEKAKNGANLERRAELELMADDLRAVRWDAPRTFHQALQLFWLYALCAGCINYGRLDVILGPFLARDLDTGYISEDEAYRYVACLWTMIENRRTTVNGRVIVGGQGRPDPEAADRFARICLKVCKDLHYVEPQFSMRFDSTTPSDIMDMAYDALGSGATYPTLYNDDVEVDAVAYGMRLPRETAANYVPFGCAEYVIQGKSVGTPNTMLNVLKLLQISLNGGIDPMDGVDRSAGVMLRSADQMHSFDDVLSYYEALLDRYMDMAVKDQMHSYEVMADEVSFLFTSILMDDCIGRDKALLDGGVEILGGTCEIYGSINASDALWAIKKLVFEQKRYTLEEIVAACNRDFSGPGGARLRLDLWRQDKYGNDLDGVDGMANRVYEYLAKGIRRRGIDAGMGYFLVVLSNNQTNTDWGHTTAASADGRRSGMYMNPSNNPQGGAAKSGPTAMLNSLARFDARYHAGNVQNIKFTPRLFNRDRAKVRMLCDTYFKKGGCQLMVTVCDKGQLEDAQIHPKHYPDLIVRVAGYSAVFVDLPKDVQDEVISRTLWDA